MIQNATFRNDGMIYLGAIDFRAWQKPWPAENRRAHVEKIESGQFIRDINVCLEKRTNRADILPISLINVGENSQVFDSSGNDILSEIGQVVIEQFADHIPLKNVYAHGGQK